MAATGIITFTVLGYDPLYFQRQAGSEDWLWTTSLNWLHGEEGAYPTITNSVYLNAGSEAQPAVIPAGATGYARELRLGGTPSGGEGYLQVEGVLTNASVLQIGGSYDGTAGKSGWMRVVSGGKCWAGSSVILGYKAGTMGRLLLDSGSLFQCPAGSTLTIGFNGTGVVAQTGGVLKVQNVNLGTNATSRGSYLIDGGTLEGSGNQSGGAITVGNGTGNGSILQSSGAITGFQNVYVGDKVSASGAYTITGGTFSASFLCVGRYGRGVVTNAGGSVILDLSISVPYHPGSSGGLSHKGGTLRALGASGIRIGFQSTGFFEAEAGFDAPVFKIGLDGGTGVANIGACVYSNIWYGSTITFPVVVGGMDSAKGGDGTLRLRGTNVKLNGKKGVVVRQTSDSQGTIRGWGSVTNCLAAIYESHYVLLNNGTVTADGEGVARDLDFSHMLAASNSLGNAVSETNGWYAVNQGRLCFPRVNFASAGTTPVRNYGTSPYETGSASAGPVNSVRAAFTNAEVVTGALIPGTSNYYAGYGSEVYASDRGDIPVGLPGEGVLAVWRLTSPSFSSADISFRYNGKTVSGGTSVLLSRRGADGVWRTVGRGDAATCCATSTGLLAVAADGNLGWFALVMKPKGTLVRIF